MSHIKAFFEDFKNVKTQLFGQPGGAREPFQYFGKINTGVVLIRHKSYLASLGILH